MKSFYNLMFLGGVMAMPKGPSGESALILSPEAETNHTHLISKRAGPACASATPNGLYLAPNSNPWLTCAGGFTYTFQPDCNFVIKQNGNVVWNNAGYANAPGDSSFPNCCQFGFQSDGNWVEYYNGKAVFNTATGGKGQKINFATTAPYVYITDGAGNVIWHS